MKEIISENLKLLAKEFNAENAKLYIVGGFVRNYLMNLPASDLDICGAKVNEEVIKICNKLHFKCVVINKKLGTLLITAGNENYEYTAFRTENYPNGGSHTPETVTFVKDIKQDAQRRDFTVNCIYYDILGDEIIDFYKGEKDVKLKKLRCIETPQKVFSSDGLRLLRLVRFACALNFKIEKNTYKQAKKFAFQLRDVSGERITKEFKEIMVSDYVNNRGNFYGMKYLNKLNLFKHAFHLSCNKFKIKLKNTYYKQFLKANKELRFNAFLILFLLNYHNFKIQSLNNITYNVNRLFGNEGLRCGCDLNALIKDYSFVQSCLFNKKLNNFVFVNYHNLTEQHKKNINIFCDKNFLSRGVLALKMKNIPLNEKELNLSNSDIAGVLGEKRISFAKKYLFEKCVLGEIKNEKEILLAQLQALKREK